MPDVALVWGLGIGFVLAMLVVLRVSAFRLWWVGSLLIDRPGFSVFGHRLVKRTEDEATAFRLR